MTGIKDNDDLLTLSMLSRLTLRRRRNGIAQGRALLCIPACIGNNKCGIRVRLHPSLVFKAKRHNRSNAIHRKEARVTFGVESKGPSDVRAVYLHFKLKQAHFALRVEVE